VTGVRSPALGCAAFDDAEARCCVYDADHLETGRVEQAAVLTGGAFPAVVDDRSSAAAAGTNRFRRNSRSVTR